MKILKNLFIIILMTFTFTIFAKDGKIYKGSVVLENGETLVGQIEMLTPTLNEVKVKFISADGKATIYKSSEVVSYSFIFPKYDAETKSYKDTRIEYVKKDVSTSPVPFGSKSVLLEREVKGVLNLYNFYIETRAAEHAFSHNYFVEKDGQMIAVTRENFKSILQDMVADYPDLKNKVGTKGYGFKYVVKIIQEYNNFTSPKSQASIMSK